MKLVVDSVEGFRGGQVCHYQDVRPGDGAVIYASASVSRTGAGRYRIEATGAVRVHPTDGSQVRYQDENGTWQDSTDGLIPEGEAIRGVTAAW